MKADDCGQEAMAKKAQKAIWLDKDLIDWADSHQNRSGASFTRIVCASMLKFFFDDPTGPDEYWMSQAVQLERGDLEFWNIPIEQANLRINMAKAAIRRARKKGFPAEEIKRLEGDLDALTAWKETLLGAGFEEKFGPEEQRIRAERESSVRKLSPEELAQTPELQDDEEGAK